MIDIIILVEDNKINLEKTLMSIYLQEIEVPYNVIIIDKDINEDIINRFKEFFPIKYIEKQNKNIKGIIEEETKSPYIAIIKSNSLFFNVESLNTLYNYALKENNNIQGKIQINDKYILDKFNAVLYIRELLENNLKEIEEIICIK